MIINNKKMKMITEKVPIDMRVNEEKTEQHPQRDSWKMDIAWKKHTQREQEWDF